MEFTNSKKNEFSFNLNSEQNGKWHKFIFQSTQISYNSRIIQVEAIEYVLILQIITALNIKLPNIQNYLKICSVLLKCRSIFHIVSFYFDFYTNYILHKWLQKKIKTSKIV